MFVLARAEAENVYFGSKPLRLGAETNVVTDRLGSVRRDVRDYFPYGQERSATAGDQEKYGTYKHDAATDLSYADQRYYATGAGRFMSADPYKASAGASEPGSWNRYAYVEGDPVNFNDPSGLARCMLVHVVTVDARSTAMFDCMSLGGVIRDRFTTDYFYDPNNRSDYRRAENDLANGSYGKQLDDSAFTTLMDRAVAIAVNALKNRSCSTLYSSQADTGANPAAILIAMAGGASPWGKIVRGATTNPIAAADITRIMSPPSDCGDRVSCGHDQ
ncbi:MAG: RHS repeat-associated core domain-containing protein [Bryobacterales bacterium]|nr:RHS repeat-associated core domain-containing protein [Bryobacterales bacterium]